MISDSLECKREPEHGWDLDITYHFYGQITYHLNENCFFKKIVIGTAKHESKFNILFQKPKKLVEFEGCLEIFNFEYDALQKELDNFEIKSVDFKQLIDVLDILLKQNYISQFIVTDIKLAISPTNLDLVRLKDAKERDEKKPSFIFENVQAKQLTFNINLHNFIINEDNHLYRRTLEDFTNYAIPTIEGLLKAKADPNSISYNKTPLMHLITSNDCHPQTKQIAHLLLQHGAKINATDWNLKTALHHAALNQNKLWIEYLLGKGADATLEDDLGRTAKQIYLVGFESDTQAVDAENDLYVEPHPAHDIQQEIMKTNTDGRPRGSTVSPRSRST